MKHSITLFLLAALLLGLAACAPAAPPAPPVSPPVQPEPVQPEPAPEPADIVADFITERLTVEATDNALQLEFEGIPYLLPLAAGAAEREVTGYAISATTYDQENSRATADIAVGGQPLATLYLYFDTRVKQLAAWPGSTVVETATGAVLPGTSLPADPGLPEIIEKSPYHDLSLPLPGYWQGGYQVAFHNNVEPRGQFLFTLYEGLCYELYPQYQAGMVFFVYRTPLEPLLSEVPEAMTEIFFAADYVFATDGPTAYVCAFPTGVEYPGDAPTLAKARYMAMVENARPLLLRFAEENGLAPNPEYFRGDF